MIQGKPLAKIAYDIIMSPLIRELQSSHPVVLQSWYADDAVARGGVLQDDKGARGGFQKENSVLWVIPQSDKEHLGHLITECTKDQGIFQQDGDQISDGEPLPGGIHGILGCPGYVVRG